MQEFENELNVIIVLQYWKEKKNSRGPQTISYDEDNGGYEN